MIKDRPQAKSNHPCGDDIASFVLVLDVTNRAQCKEGESCIDKYNVKDVGMQDDAELVFSDSGECHERVPYSHKYGETMPDWKGSMN